MAAKSVFIGGLCACIVMLLGCDPIESNGPSHPGSTDPIANEKSLVVPPKPVQDDTAPHSQPIEQYAVMQFIGMWVEWRARANWDFTADYAKALGWRPLPPELLPLINVDGSQGGHAFLMRRTSTHAIMVGINPVDDSASVAVAGTYDIDAVIEYLQEYLQLNELAALDDVGQKSMVYAATDKSERIGLIIITESDAESLGSIVVIALIDWKRAVRLTPKLNKTFDELVAPYL